MGKKPDSLGKVGVDCENYQATPVWRARNNPVSFSAITGSGNMKRVDGNA